MSNTFRWAALLLVTVALAQLMNLVAFGYFAYGQTQESAPAQAEVVADDQPPVDFMPVTTPPGASRMAVPPDRAADNRAAADGS